MDTWSHSTYNYDPIQRDQVRLMRLNYDSHGDISAVLEPFPVGGPGPSYRALSYTWLADEPSTDASGTQDYFLETERGMLPILGTVHAFFRLLISKGSELDNSWWWIDSICINLEDKDERSQQVQLMGQIYHDAHEVVIWVGEESEHTNDGADFIHVLNETVRQKTGPSSSEQLRRIFEQDRYQPSWTALESFFRQRWWSRIWTLQEYAMNQNTTFWWGKRTISRSVVDGALIGADQCTPAAVAFKATTAFRHGFSRRRIQTLYQNGQANANPHTEQLYISWVALAAYSSFFEAGNDLDRLYGIRALVTDTSFLHVDYTSTVEEVYVRFAKAHIDHHKSLDVICFATILSSPSLPSWVPDWRAKTEHMSAPLMVSQSGKREIGNLRNFALTVDDPSAPSPPCYAASGDCASVYTFQGLKLVARGHIVDSVDGLAAGWGDADVELVQCSAHQLNLKAAAPLSVSSSPPAPEIILRSVCKSLALDRKDRFMRFAMPVDEFFHDFMWLCGQLVMMGSGGRPVPKEFEEWYNCTKSLVIRGRSFEDMLHDMEETVEVLSASPAPNLDEYIFDTFFGRFFDTVVRMSRRLMVTRNGHIGMAPAKACKGDLVGVLYGCSVPVLLRQSIDEGGRVFNLVGECFLDGFMDGEGLGGDAYLAEDICIN